MKDQIAGFVSVLWWGGLLLAPAWAEPPRAQPRGYTPAEIEKLAPEKCRRMAEVPEGEFLFGDTYAASNNLPAPRRPRKEKTGKFLIDKCETTGRQFMAWYTAYVDTKTRYGALRGEEGDRPAVNKQYRLAAAYCKFMGKRLPTEQEWEKAARGGTESLFWWGDQWPGADNEYEWNLEKYVNRVNYQPAGRKKPNPYGLYDTLGNAREMTSGDYDKGGSTKLTNSLASPGKSYPKSSGGAAGDLGWRCVKDIKGAE